MLLSIYGVQPKLESQHWEFFCVFLLSSCSLSQWLSFSPCVLLLLSQLMILSPIEQWKLRQLKGNIFPTFSFSSLGLLGKLEENIFL